MNTSPIIPSDVNSKISNSAYQEIYLKLKNYVKKGRFPIKIEHKRILANIKYYQLKLDQHLKIINSANVQLTELNSKCMELRRENEELIQKIKY